MPRELAPNIHFVRSNGGSGSYPVTPQGWAIARNFMLGMIATGVFAALLAFVAPAWAWVAALVVGFAGSAWWFITTARRHTDFSITYNEYVRSRAVRE